MQPYSQWIKLVTHAIIFVALTNGPTPPSVLLGLRAPKKAPATPLPGAFAQSAHPHLGGWFHFKRQRTFVKAPPMLLDLEARWVTVGVARSSPRADARQWRVTWGAIFHNTPHLAHCRHRASNASLIQLSAASAMAASLRSASSISAMPSLPKLNAH